MKMGVDDADLISSLRSNDDKGFLCGKVLGDLGADVVKIKPPGGDPARSMAPFYKDIPHPEKSLFWLYTNLDKKGSARRDKLCARLSGRGRRGLLLAFCGPYGRLLNGLSSQKG